MCKSAPQLPGQILCTRWIARRLASQPVVEDRSGSTLVIVRAGEVHGEGGAAAARAGMCQMNGPVYVHREHDRDVGEGVVEATVAVPIVGVVEESHIPGSRPMALVDVPTCLGRIPHRSAAALECDAGAIKGCADEATAVVSKSLGGSAQVVVGGVCDPVAEVTPTLRRGGRPLDVHDVLARSSLGERHLEAHWSQWSRHPECARGTCRQSEREEREVEAVGHGRAGVGG